MSFTVPAISFLRFLKLVQIYITFSTPEPNFSVREILNAKRTTSGRLWENTQILNLTKSTLEKTIPMCSTFSMHKTPVPPFSSRRRKNIDRKTHMEVPLWLQFSSTFGHHRTISHPSFGFFWYGFQIYRTTYQCSWTENRNDTEYLSRKRKRTYCVTTVFHASGTFKQPLHPAASKFTVKSFQSIALLLLTSGSEISPILKTFSLNVQFSTFHSISFKTHQKEEKDTEWTQNDISKSMKSKPETSKAGNELTGGFSFFYVHIAGLFQKWVLLQWKHILLQINCTKKATIIFPFITNTARA